MPTGYQRLEGENKKSQVAGNCMERVTELVILLA